MAVTTLRDGSRVVIRPIEPGDKAALLDGFARLSERSRYRRFLSPTPRLTETQLRYLAEVDHENHEAVIAFAEAEPAVTVVDDWQGRGLGSALLEAISDRARGAGVRRFTATVLAENTPMLALIEHVGPTERHSVGDGVIEITAGLPEAGSPAGMHAALRDAAAERIELVRGQTPP